MDPGRRGVRDEKLLDLPHDDLVFHRGSAQFRLTVLENWIITTRSISEDGHAYEQSPL